MSYQVGVDLGATYSAAAVSVAGRAGLPEIVPLAARSPFIPSVVFADSSGTLLVGEPAERRALTEPGRLARQFTRRIGDGTPLRIGGLAVAAEVLAARVVWHVLTIVATRLGGGAARVAVTHPAGWGPHRLTALRAALAKNGLGSALLVSEPQAAAIAYASREPVEPGAAVAVYDLGGGGFTATVVRKVAAGQFMLVGQPEELDLSGLDLDEVVFDHVRSAVGPAWDALDPTDPDVLAAVARLRRGCIAAKEALSADTEVLIPVLLPGIDTQVRLGRAEFEEMIRPAVAETVEALHRVLAAAGTSPDELAAVLLVGGSARIPLVTQEVSAQLGRPVPVGTDPKGIIAMGAALAARGPEPEPAPGTPPVPVVEDATTLLADQVTVPPTWARPPLRVSPLSTLTGGPWRRRVMPVAATILFVLLFAGGVALANRYSAPGPSPGPSPTASPTTPSRTVTDSPVPPVDPSQRQPPPVVPSEPSRAPSTTPVSATPTPTPSVSATPTPTPSVSTTTTTTAPTTTGPTTTGPTTTGPTTTAPTTTGPATTAPVVSTTSGGGQAPGATPTRTP